MAGITGTMEPDIALLAVRKRIVLLIIRAATAKASRMKSVFSFLSFFVFLLSHELFELFLISQDSLGWPIIVLYQFIVLKEVKVVNFIIL